MMSTQSPFDILKCIVEQNTYILKMMNQRGFVLPPTPAQAPARLLRSNSRIISNIPTQFPFAIAAAADGVSRGRIEDASPLSPSPSPSPSPAPSSTSLARGRSTSRRAFMSRHSLTPSATSTAASTSNEQDRRRRHCSPSPPGDTKRRRIAPRMSMPVIENHQNHQKNDNNKSRQPTMMTRPPPVNHNEDFESSLTAPVVTDDEDDEHNRNDNRKRKKKQSDGLPRRSKRLKDRHHSVRSRSTSHQTDYNRISSEEESSEEVNDRFDSINSSSIPSDHKNNALPHIKRTSNGSFTTRAKLLEIGKCTFPPTNATSPEATYERNLIFHSILKRYREYEQTREATKRRGKDLSSSSSFSSWPRTSYVVHGFRHLKHRVDFCLRAYCSARYKHACPVQMILQYEWDTQIYRFYKACKHNHRLDAGIVKWDQILEEETNMPHIEVLVSKFSPDSVDTNVTIKKEPI